MISRLHAHLGNFSPCIHTLQPEVELNQNPINYGAWDSCASAKVVPINTVMRAKREFLTPAWEREALAKLKEEGRDIASIDKDLKVFAHQMILIYGITDHYHTFTCFHN